MPKSVIDSLKQALCTPRENLSAYLRPERECEQKGGEPIAPKRAPAPLRYLDILQAARDSVMHALAALDARDEPPVPQTFMNHLDKAHAELKQAFNTVGELERNTAAMNQIIHGSFKRRLEQLPDKLKYTHGRLNDLLGALNKHMRDETENPHHEQDALSIAMRGNEWAAQSLANALDALGTFVTEYNSVLKQQHKGR